MDGVIIDSAAGMSQYVSESCFKYRSYGKNRIDRYRRWKRNSGLLCCAGSRGAEGEA